MYSFGFGACDIEFVEDASSSATRERGSRSGGSFVLLILFCLPYSSNTTTKL